MLGVGRSGTTILQHLLNTAPGVEIKGENGGMVWPLIDSYGRLKQAKESGGRWATAWSGDPWFGFEQVSETRFGVHIRDTLVNLVFQPSPEATRLGFKEIRFPEKNLVRSCRLVLELFPGTLFVLNFREVSRIAASGWWANRKFSKLTIARRQARLGNLQKHLGRHCYPVQYSTFHAETAERARLFDWLGLEYDPSAAEEALRTRLRHASAG